MPRKRLPSIRAQVPGSVWNASDADSGALISIERTADGKLLIEIYRADADVVVRAPFANLESLTAQAANPGKPDLMTYAAEGGLS